MRSFFAYLGPTTLAAAVLVHDARAQTPRPLRPAIIPGSGGWLALGCSNPRTQQDTAKTPVIENTTAAPIPRGKTLLWTASDGDHGGVTLGQDLAPGGAVRGTGKPARMTYTCSANFHAGMPDLVILSASHERIPTAVVQNQNPWIGVEGVRVRFESLRCADDTVLVAKVAGPLGVAAGAKQTFTAWVTKPWKSPRAYWRITVDFDRRVAESNEQNNVWTNLTECPDRKADSRIAARSAEKKRRY